MEILVADAVSLVADSDGNVLVALADGDLDGWQLGGSAHLFVVLDSGSVGILEQLSQDVLEVDGDVGEHGVCVAVDDGVWALAIVEFTQLSYKVRAGFDQLDGSDLRVNDAHQTVCLQVFLLHQCNGLFRNETDAYPCLDHVVQEPRHVLRVHILLAFQEAYVDTHQFLCGSCWIKRKYLWQEWEYCRYDVQRNP